MNSSVSLGVPLRFVGCLSLGRNQLFNFYISSLNKATHVTTKGAWLNRRSEERKQKKEAILHELSKSSTPGLYLHLGTGVGDTSCTRGQG